MNDFEMQIRQSPLTGASDQEKAMDDKSRGEGVGAIVVCCMSKM